MSVVSIPAFILLCCKDHCLLTAATSLEFRPVNTACLQNTECEESIDRPDYDKLIYKR